MAFEIVVNQDNNINKFYAQFTRTDLALIFSLGNIILYSLITYIFRMLTQFSPNTR